MVAKRSGEFSLPKSREGLRINLKRLLYEEFKSKAKPGPEYFDKFYDVVRTINKALGNSDVSVGVRCAVAVPKQVTVPGSKGTG